MANKKIELNEIRSEFNTALDTLKSISGTKFTQTGPTWKNLQLVYDSWAGCPIGVYPDSYEDILSKKQTGRLQDPIFTEITVSIETYCRLEDSKEGFGRVDLELEIDYFVSLEVKSQKEEGSVFFSLKSFEVPPETPRMIKGSSGQVAFFCDIPDELIDFVNSAKRQYLSNQDIE